MGRTRRAVFLFVLLCSVVAPAFSTANPAASSSEEFDFLSEELTDAEELVRSSAGIGAADRREISISVREIVKECGVKGISLQYDKLFRETLACNEAAVAHGEALATRLARTYSQNEAWLKGIADRMFSGVSLTNAEKTLLTTGFFEPICTFLGLLNDCGADQTNFPEIAKMLECEEQVARDTGKLASLMIQDVCKKNMSWFFDYLDSKPCTDQMETAVSSAAHRDSLARVREFNAYMKGLSTEELRKKRADPNNWAEVCFTAGELGGVYKSMFDVDSCYPQGQRKGTRAGAAERPFQIWLDTFRDSREFWNQKCAHVPPPPRRIPATRPRPPLRDFNFDPPPPIWEHKPSFTVKQNSGMSSALGFSLIMGCVVVLCGLIKMCQKYRKS